MFSSTPTTSFSFNQSTVSSTFTNVSCGNASKKSSILKYCDKMNANENKNIDVLLARAVYATAAPLNLVDNSYWIEFFKALRPAYKPPTRHLVSNKLLDDKFSKVKEHTTICIADSDALGVMCDGWTNIRNESIINFVVTTPKPIFYKSLPTGVDRHTGEHIAEQIISVIEDIGPRKVFGVVTDNAKNMKKAWILITEKYPHITSYGCVAHGLNLLINDIIKMNSLKDIINDGKDIVNNIKRGHITSAAFLDKRNANSSTSMALLLPVVTRWGSVVVFFKSLLVNKQIIRSMNVDEIVEKDLKPNVKKTISSSNFWKKVEFFYSLMNPVAKWITKIESDTPQLSIVPIIFTELKKSFEETLKNNNILRYEEKHNIMEALDQRKEFCQSKIHKAANLLDPKYLGKLFDSNDHNEAIEFIYQLSKHMDNIEIDARKVISDFAFFKNKSGPFSKTNEYLWVAAEETEALHWWTAFCNHTELSKIAIKILSLPATSAAVERTFSTYKDVHSSKRNRLLNERAAKLVFIKHNLQVIINLLFYR